jgi:hypothetical protein
MPRRLAAPGGMQGRYGKGQDQLVFDKGEQRNPLAVDLQGFVFGRQRDRFRFAPYNAQPDLGFDLDGHWLQAALADDFKGRSDSAQGDRARRFIEIEAKLEAGGALEALQKRREAGHAGQRNFAVQSRTRPGQTHRVNELKR